MNALHLYPVIYLNASAALANPAPMLAATPATVTGWSKLRWLPSGSVITGMRKRLRLNQKRALPRCENALVRIGRREWDRTTDHHHVKVVLYH